MKKEKKLSQILGLDLFGVPFMHSVGIGPDADPQVKKYNSFPIYSFVETGPIYPVSPVEAPSYKFPISLFKSGKNEVPPGLQEAIDSIGSRPRPLFTKIMANIAALPSHTDCESLTADLLKSFTWLYDFVDLFVIDTFRKNAYGTCPLQSHEYLSESMDALLDMRLYYDQRKPILLRVAPEITDSSLESMLDYMMYSGIDGIIAGSSGNPLPLVERIEAASGGRFPIVACGTIGTSDIDPLKAKGVVLFETDRKNARNLLSYFADTQLK